MIKNLLRLGDRSEENQDYWQPNDCPVPDCNHEESTSFMKRILSRVKPFVQWLIFGGMLFYLVKAFKQHWQEVAAIRIDPFDWFYLASAIAVTMLSFACAGWVWSWILKEFKYPLNSAWVIKVYLQTHIAKYLPGHVWHYYGRILNAKQAGVAPEIATLTVVMEPFLMIAAALLVALFSSHLSGGVAVNSQNFGFQIPFLCGILTVVHPRVLNPLMRIAKKVQKQDEGEQKNCNLERYPLKLLVGELGFISLRCGGFLLTFIALNPIELNQLPIVVSAFCLAWLLSVVLPGGPGGVGVFEATAIALLNQSFPTGVVLSIVALFRFITILAEASGAGLAWLYEHYHSPSYSLDNSVQEAEYIRINE